jgi:alkylation response protein AidB-like acyl-CoA dehydrogenase
MSGQPDGAAVDYVERARALSPLIAAEANETERDRRVTDKVMAALHEAGFFRLLLPRAYGGAEVDPVTFVRVVETIAKADASTAWCLGQNGVTATSAAFLEPEVAREIFGPPRAILAWGPGPNVRGVAVEGGYRISGTWTFASGGRHATWFGAQTPVFREDGTPLPGHDGKPALRLMLVPAAKVEMIDVWNVIGLRGTGSDSYTVSDLFVPHRYSFDRDSKIDRRQPGPLYNYTLNGIFSGVFAGVALGISRAIVDSFVELAARKTPRGMPNPLAQSNSIQLQVAQMEARLRSARTYLLTTLQEVWDAQVPNSIPSTEHRIAVRLAASNAIAQAVKAADAAYQLAGATVIFASGPFERRFRDLHTVAQQLQGRQSHFETVGRHLLGLEPDSGFI